MSGNNVKIIERKINNDLRKAQNKMFSGKNDEAWDMIEEVWTDIEKIHSIDSNYKGLKSLEQKYGKLKGDLERKLGKVTPTPKKSKAVPVPPQKLALKIQEKTPAAIKTNVNLLPSGVLKRLEEIEKPLLQAKILLNQAQSSSDTDKAKRQIQLAERKYEEIERMYKDDLNHPQVIDTRDKISAMKKELVELSAKVLPAGVEKRLGDMEIPLERAIDFLDEAETSSDLDKAKYQLTLAQGTYDEIVRMYQDYLNNTEVVKAKDKLDQIKDRIEKVSNKIQAGEEQEELAKTKMEEMSKAWVQKIRPYLIGGGVPEKQLNLSRIRGKENFIQQKNLLEEAQSVYQEYVASNWSGGKTWDLEQAEKDLLSMINDGKEAFDQSIKSVIEEAGSIIDEKLTWFKKDNAWLTDSSIRPSWLYTRDRESIEEKMSLVKELVPEIIQKSNTMLTNLENKFAELMEKNLERLAVIPKRTFMVPSKYVGDDSIELESKAGELVKEKVPDATILKVHLIREDWRVEDVIEHTDTSKTAIRHRITYHLPTQVAAQVGDKVLLYNAHIAKNQRPDGSFDSLTGNLEDYPQTIDPENLPK